MGYLVVPWKVHKTHKIAQKYTKVHIFSNQEDKGTFFQDPRFSFHKSSFDIKKSSSSTESAAARTVGSATTVT